MHRVATRALFVLLFVLILLVGFILFTAEFVINAEKWVFSAGSPHVYGIDSTNVQVVVDGGNIILVNTEQEKIFSSDQSIRESMVHWTGDGRGNILTPFITLPEKDRFDYDLLGGLYTYDEPEIFTQLTLQSYAQTQALEALGDYRGTVAVYNYKTGEILCAVSTPTFDPADPPATAIDGMYFNRFLQGLYTPGSIFKIVTLAAALETLPEAQSMYLTCKGSYDVGGRVVTCERAHGQQDLQTAFRNSCNCAFAHLSGLLGSDVIKQYADRFGLTDKLTLDGLNTATGHFDAARDDFSVALSAIGQYTDQVNPCTFLHFLGAIAGDGTGALPYVISEVKADGEVMYSAKTQPGQQLMSQSLAKLLQEYMRNNVALKYGDDHFPGLNVCAKTGTAEQDGKTPTAMLAGFVADEEYPLAFIICVEEGGYGANTCLPIASKVLAACKLILDNG